MDTNPHRWIAALRTSQNRLATIVQPLTSGQIQGPSYHSWSIAEALGHLGSQAEIFDAWLTAALEGAEPPGREFMQPIWDAWNVLPPEAAVANSLSQNEQLVQRFEALTDDQLASMHLNLFGMELDGSGLVRLRLSELALHTWDVDVALNPGARVMPDAVDLLIDTLGPVASRTGKPSGTTANLHVHTDGPVRDFSLRIGDAVELIDWDTSAADGELRIPAEAFVRLVYGRLDREHTPRLDLNGPVSLDDLRRIFPGV